MEMRNVQSVCIHHCLRRGGQPSGRVEAGQHDVLGEAVRSPLMQTEMQGSGVPVIWDHSHITTNNRLHLIIRQPVLHHMFISHTSPLNYEISHK